MHAIIRWLAHRFANGSTRRAKGCHSFSLNSVEGAALRTTGALSGNRRSVIPQSLRRALQASFKGINQELTFRRRQNELLA
jgi:hypothetical protein